MKIEYRKAETEDAEMLVNIYNASFYSDYRRFGACPGYGKTIEMMEKKNVCNFPGLCREVVHRSIFLLWKALWLSRHIQALLLK